MEACTLPGGVKVSEGLQKSEFIGCNLNPVVVLTDYRKSLTSGATGLSKSPGKDDRGIAQIPGNVDSKTGSKELRKVKGEISIVRPRRSMSLKRKRGSWDLSVEYEIEKIVGYHRDKRKKMWYLVKWKNWPESYNTFEPIGNLTRCHYELMKYFEIKKPTSEMMMAKDTEVEEALKKQAIYNRLVGSGYRAEDLADFMRQFPEAGQLFETKNIEEMEGRIRQEYKYIVRCLIGMCAHQDPGLFARGQNYKLLLKLIHLRRKQLRINEGIENFINAREETKIVIENKVDLEEFPRITYIVEVMAGNGVILPKGPLVGCECADGCSQKSRCCGVMADSVFAYGPTGKLRTNERVAIYECNSQCRCPPTCPNRVVQRGRQVKLCIFKTRSCGWGVKAMEKIPKGTFVCEYIGELIPDSEAAVRDLIYHKEKRTGYLFDLDFFMDSDLDMYCIDATEHGNVARFINHSCDPNLVVYAVWVDGLEPNLHRLAFFARRNIQKGEEIQFDYENLCEFPENNSEENKVNHGVRMMSDVRCKCNATNCRQWVFGNK